MKNDRPEFVLPRELMENFTATVNAAANGDAENIQERKRVRAEVEVATVMAGEYIMMKLAEDKDPITLLMAGEGTQISRAPRTRSKP